MSRKYHVDGTQPTDGTIFVFGSNLAGRHGGGAAKAALDHFGAEWGVGFGPTGRAFAIPTKDRVIESLPLEDIEQHVSLFIAHAILHPEQSFFVTRIGCVLAGYDNSQIAPMFADAPDNCFMPEPWKEYLA